MINRNASIGDKLRIYYQEYLPNKNVLPSKTLSSDNIISKH